MSERSTTRKLTRNGLRGSVRRIDPGKSRYVSLTGNALSGAGAGVASASPNAPRRYGSATRASPATVAPRCIVGAPGALPAQRRMSFRGYPWKRRRPVCLRAGGEAIPLMATVVRRDVGFYINRQELTSSSGRQRQRPGWRHRGSRCRGARHSSRCSGPSCVWSPKRFRRCVSSRAIPAGCPHLATFPQT